MRSQWDMFCTRQPDTTLPRIVYINFFNILEKYIRNFFIQDLNSFYSYQNFYLTNVYAFWMQMGEFHDHRSFGKLFQKRWLISRERIQMCQGAKLQLFWVEDGACNAKRFLNYHLPQVSYPNGRNELEEPDIWSGILFQPFKIKNKSYNRFTSHPYFEHLWW